MIANIEENGITLFLSAEDYNEQVIHKCFYWYTRDFNVGITRNANDSHRITLRTKSGQSVEEGLTEKISNDLVDFKLRDIVSKETRTIRELLVAKAFAYADLEHGQKPDVADPVGFDPASIF